MQRLALVAVVVLALVLGGTALWYRQQLHSTSGALERTSEAEQRVRAEYDRTITAIAEIQDSLDAISPSDPALRLAPSVSGEGRLSGPSGQQVLDRIGVLRASIERNRDRISQLEDELARSGKKVAGLERLIANLKATVSAKESQIAALQGQVDSLSTQVTGLQSQVQKGEELVRAREQALEERRRELATVLVVIGTRRQLESAGVVSARGGILGLGRTLTAVDPADDTVFTPLDTDQQTVLQLPAGKPTVLSAQPRGSYEIRVVDGQQQLHILDAREFRKVKQVVIVMA